MISLAKRSTLFDRKCVYILIFIRKELTWQIHFLFSQRKTELYLYVSHHPIMFIKCFQLFLFLKPDTESVICKQFIFLTRSFTSSHFLSNAIISTSVLQHFLINVYDAVCFILFFFPFLNILFPSSNEGRKNANLLN